MRSVLAVFGVLILAIIGLRTAPAEAVVPAATQLVNFDGSGNQVVRFDTDGNAVDAHDGQIARFGDTYYLYGTSYDCGYRWHVNQTFCGFKVYTSPDLVHWTDRGYVVPRGQCADCFRPHVLYNSETRQYVLWVNDQGTTSNYDVYTAPTPTGPFQKQAPPHLAVPCGGDFTLFKDDDGTAYFSCRGQTVEELTSDYLSGNANYVTTGPFSVEAPAMFKRKGIYYLAMSSICPYCTSSSTTYLEAPSPLGPWSSPAGTTWQIENGALVADGGELGLSSTGNSWGNYTFSFDGTPFSNGRYAQLGWAVRVDSGYNGYGWLLSNFPYSSPAAPGYIVRIKYTAGQPSILARIPLTTPVIGGKTYHIATTVSGNTLTASVNGTVVDSFTETDIDAGKVGFREGAGESAAFDNVKVLDSNGNTLLNDDFSGGLSNWTPPPRATSISSNSCGGQLSFITQLPTPGGPTYLYGSDLWNGHLNEGLANYYWAPLSFNADGTIKPITCTPASTVQLAGAHPGQQNQLSGQDQTSGIEGFHVSCAIAAGRQEAQSFTVGRAGVLRQIRLTVFQNSAAGLNDVVNAPLTLQLLDANGAVVAQQSFDPSEVGFTARELSLEPDLAVTIGAKYTVVASSSTTSGCYGIVANDTNPYPSGAASMSTDGGVTFTAEPSTDLKFRTVIDGT